MSTPPVTSNTTAAEAQPSANRIPMRTLGQAEFLQILVKQLTTQDPLSPQKDTEFIGQMAQFSQLESSKTVTAELTSLREQQDFLKANSLIGRRVQVDTGESSHIGTVTGIEMDKGKPMLQIGEATFGLADVIRVDQPAKGTYAN